MTATGAGLGTGKPRVDLDQVFAGPLGLIRQFRDQAVPAGIRYMLGQLPVLQQVLNLQSLNHHCLVFVNELSRQFMLEISTGVGQALMRLGDQQPGFRPAPAAFLAARQGFLLAPQVVSGTF